MGEQYLDTKTWPAEVVVHPIVLLSVVDHYNRVAKGTSKRVVGTLLGETRSGKLHITSSFAVPFEEETRDPQVWFLDHNYHEQLAQMFRKVNAKEQIVGWYSSGPKIKPADIMIHELFRKYHPEPVLVILDIAPKENDFPMEVYCSVQEKTSDETFTRTFKSLPCAFGADEAEDVGVEHLLRDIRNQSTSTLATRVADKCTGLGTLIEKLQDVFDYLGSVLAGKYPYNPAIIDRLQDLFNELPEMAGHTEMLRACASEVNDHYVGIYTGSLLRAILALHNLVLNKVKNKKFYEEEAKEEKQKAEAKEKAVKEKKAEK